VRTDVTSIAETVTAAPVVVHRPWWRGKLVRVAVIVALMYLCYLLWTLEYPWPDRLVWNSLDGHFDDFQTWLLDQRIPRTSVVFALFDGFATFVVNFVNWFDRLLLWLTGSGRPWQAR
jgi:hypothetical protein